jgi:hypothetical protein
MPVELLDAWHTWCEACDWSVIAQDYGDALKPAGEPHGRQPLMPVESYTLYQAWCSECGWDAQGFETRDDAANAVERHMEDKH